MVDFSVKCHQASRLKSYELPIAIFLSLKVSEKTSRIKNVEEMEMRKG